MKGCEGRACVRYFRKEADTCLVVLVIIGKKLIPV
jgi:hypothetical protein